jgi:hypothetical protein
MAQQPYMGPGLLLPPLFVAVGDWSTGRATVSIDPDVPARANTILNTCNSLLLIYKTNIRM